MKAEKRGTEVAIPCVMPPAKPDTLCWCLLFVPSHWDCCVRFLGFVCKAMRTYRKKNNNIETNAILDSKTNEDRALLILNSDYPEQETLVSFQHSMALEPPSTFPPCLLPVLRTEMVHMWEKRRKTWLYLAPLAWPTLHLSPGHTCIPDAPVHLELHCPSGHALLGCIFTLES